MNGSEISFLAAFGGGAISFLSPCVLPLVPAYLSFISGRSLEELTADDSHRREAMAGVMVTALAFVAGFSVVFISLGASASAISRFLIAYMDILARVAGVVIVLFGLHFMGLFRLALLNREVRFNPPGAVSGWPGAFVIGLAFAFGWTPCIGPILATILTIAAGHDDLGFGVSLLAVYSLGLGLPFLLAALGMQRFLNFFQRIRAHLRKVEMVAGALLVITGGLIFFGSLQTLGTYMLEIAPWLQNIG